MNPYFPRHSLTHIRSRTTTAYCTCSWSAQAPILILPHHGREYGQSRSRHRYDNSERSSHRTGRYADARDRSSVDDRLRTRQVRVNQVERCGSAEGWFRILVLDQGRVVEFGTPWELIQKEEGMFRDLCRQSGEETQLFEVRFFTHSGRS